MDETRVRLLSSRLQPVLAAELPPDAAGSKALALALLAAQAETEQADGGTAQREALARDIHLLPAFIAQAQEGGSGVDFRNLVSRFVQGERPPMDSVSPAASTAARRRARLRELQRGGIDLSLIEATLAQTPAVRIANMERQLLLVRQLQQAKREQRQERPPEEPPEEPRFDQERGLASDSSRP